MPLFGFVNAVRGRIVMPLTTKLQSDLLSYHLQLPTLSRENNLRPPLWQVPPMQGVSWFAHDESSARRAADQDHHQKHSFS